jgi:hypothetical protein
VPAGLYAFWGHSAAGEQVVEQYGLQVAEQRGRDEFDVAVHFGLAQQQAGVGQPELVRGAGVAAALIAVGRGQIEVPVGVLVADDSRAEASIRSTGAAPGSSGGGPEITAAWSCCS